MENLQHIQANGIEIAYETFGKSSDPPMLLVMGLGTQMLGWPDELCEQLAAEGFYVVRFDNRDIGLSTHLHETPAPDIIRVALRRLKPPYRIEDMATDAIAFIEAMELGPVHLVGASMGGFIAQSIVLDRPDLVRSLTLIMTSTGSRRVGHTAPKIIATVLRRKPAEGRLAAIDASVDMFRLIGSPAYPMDEDFHRDLAGRSYDRGYDPAGAQRQLAATVAQTNRTSALASVAVPTLVMHGLSDPLVSASGGLALARVIPGAKFVGYQGMGHDFPRALWPDFAREIVDNTKRINSGLPE
jgi:pimeloyl-ACP methyl ester carboxylesterase